MAREIYVAGLPSGSTEEGVRKLFSVAGRVVSVRPIIDAESGKFRGCAYVKMSSDAEAVDAIASLDLALFEGHIITVTESRTRAERMKSQPPPPQASKRQRKPAPPGSRPRRSR